MENTLSSLTGGRVGASGTAGEGKGNEEKSLKIMTVGKGARGLGMMIKKDMARPMALVSRKSEVCEFDVS